MDGWGRQSGWRGVAKGRFFPLFAAGGGGLLAGFLSLVCLWWVYSIAWVSIDAVCLSFLSLSLLLCCVIPSSRRQPTILRQTDRQTDTLPPDRVRRFDLSWWTAVKPPFLPPISISFSSSQHTLHLSIRASLMRSIDPTTANKHQTHNTDTGRDREGRGQDRKTKIRLD